MTTSKIITRVTSINRAKIVSDATCGLPDGTHFDLTNAGTLIVTDGPFKGMYRTVKVAGPRWIGDNGYTFERDLNAADTITLNTPYDLTGIKTSTEARDRHFARLIDLIVLNSPSVAQPAPTTREELWLIASRFPTITADVETWCTGCGTTWYETAGNPLPACPECKRDQRYIQGPIVTATPIEVTPEQASAVDVVAVKTAELIDKAPATPRPITDAMVEKYPMLTKIALRFVESYTGRNPYVQDLAVWLQDQGTLSIKQMRGALNQMITEARAAGLTKVAHDTITPAASAFHINIGETIVDDARKAGKLDGNALDRKIDADMRLAGVTPTHGTPIAWVPGESEAQRIIAERAINELAAQEAATRVPNGTYTVPINDFGEYRVIKLTDCPERYNKPAGTQIAAYQSGADNENDYTGFAFVSGTRSGIWPKFRNAREIQFALTKLLTLGKAQEFGKLWAMESKRCYICGKKLTTPLSKAAGIGPDCADANGISQAALALMGTKAGAIEENDMRDVQAKMNDLFD